MGRRWKWFLRAGPVALDLTGQPVPDGDVPGRFRRLPVEQLVPELRLTSRCDGAEVYERPEERPAGSRNRRAGRDDEGRAGRRNRGRFPTPICPGPPGVGSAEPDRVESGEDEFASGQLAQANRLFNQHWRRPGEDWRTRKCPGCHPDGSCPRAAWAEATIARILRRRLR
ncbi:hypothetical protein JMF97_07925 [Micromonospora fiedleri]|uniref:Uncharacterized protein n=1 Tax=Micromonospora fiedleri TaxID=1157498 RepID=A0ABS1UIC4_9ACTN|nr:hypothetical protein [Micromonospora fiedleri]MBL6276086.1 hypothetical protein [Micromonospora fiedleri]